MIEKSTFKFDSLHNWWRLFLMIEPYKLYLLLKTMQFSKLPWWFFTTDSTFLLYLGLLYRWEAGPKSIDGIWAPWWYESVHKSTGFQKPNLHTIVSSMLNVYYETMLRIKIVFILSYFMCNNFVNKFYVDIILEFFLVINSFQAKT